MFLFLLPQSFLGHFPLKGLAPSTLLPGLAWVTSPYNFSKLGMSSSASLCGKSSPVIIIRESPVGILKNHLDTSSREPLWSRGVGWSDLPLRLPFCTILWSSSLPLAQSVPVCPDLTLGAPTSPVQRGGVRSVREVLSMAPRRSVATLPVAMAQACGQLGAARFLGKAPALQHAWAGGCGAAGPHWAWLALGEGAEPAFYCL